MKKLNYLHSLLVFLALATLLLLVISDSVPAALAVDDGQVSCNGVGQNGATYSGWFCPSDSRIAYWGRWNKPTAGSLAPAITIAAGSYFIFQFTNTTHVSLDFIAPPPSAVFSGYSQGIYVKFFPNALSQPQDFCTSIFNRTPPPYPMYHYCGSNFFSAGAGHESVQYMNIQGDASQGTFNPSTTYTMVVYVQSEGNWYWSGSAADNAARFREIRLDSSGTLINLPSSSSKNGLTNPDLSIEFAGASITAGTSDGYMRSFTAQAGTLLNNTGHGVPLGLPNYSVEYSNWGLPGRAVSFDNGPPPPSSDFFNYANINWRSNYANNGSSLNSIQTPNIVVVDFGTNDFIHNPNAPVSYTNALINYINQVFSYYPGVNIYVIAPLACPSSYCNGIYSFHDAAFSAVQQVYTYNNAVHFVNSTNWLPPSCGNDSGEDYPEWLLPDCLHLSNRGAKDAGQLLANRISGDLSKDIYNNVHIAPSLQ